jgi:hypothetical protein
MMLAADLLFYLADFRREEFHRGATFGAHHVVMTAAVVLMLVTSDAIVESDLASESGAGQELERPIYRGETDVRILFLDQAVQLISGKMFAGFEKCPQNRIALASLLQAYPPKMLQKDRFGFADTLTRDAGLIVDTLLEHCGSENEAQSDFGSQT